MDYSELLKSFKEWVTTDKEAQRLWAKASGMTATYKDAELYSDRIGNKWGALIERYSGDYDAHLNDIQQSLFKAYSESAYYSKTVQNGLNKRARIGMKAIEPHIDESRISHLIEKLEDEEAEFLLGKDVVKNIARSAVYDTIQANARIQSKAGLVPMIERDTGSGCCAWCEEIAGKYEYGNQPDDFFRVHKDCTCSITFTPTRGGVQHIHYETVGGRMRKIVE